MDATLCAGRARLDVASEPPRTRVPRERKARQYAARGGVTVEERWGWGEVSADRVLKVLGG